MVRCQITLCLLKTPITLRKSQKSSHAISCYDSTIVVHISGPPTPLLKQSIGVVYCNKNNIVLLFSINNVMTNEKIIQFIITLLVIDNEKCYLSYMKASLSHETLIIRVQFSFITSSLNNDQKLIVGKKGEQGPKQKKKNNQPIGPLQMTMGLK